MPFKRKLGIPRDRQPNSVDCSRFYRYHELGMSLPDIAKEDGITMITVRGSLDKVRAYRGRFSASAVLHSQAETVMQLAGIERIALEKALTATTMIEVPDEDGEGTTMKEVPNHEINLQAAEIITRKVEVIQPKGGKGFSIQTNVGVVSAPQAASSQPRGFSIEERMRELQAKRQGLLPESVEPSRELHQVQPSPVEAFDAEAELLHSES